ncbi:MAG: Sec-independent protein translocase protein TatB [Rhodobacteraceae bacterium]|nr:Sec-independent protein translocase protein TatB [Paracoccaceae bacterium]
MFDIGWTELMLIGVVALIVIGPRDLPEMFRTLGRFTAKLRSMSRDFSRAMEQAAKESGVKDVASDLKSVANPSSLGLNAVKDAATKFENWDPLKSSKPAAVKPPAHNVALPPGKILPEVPPAPVPAAADGQASAADMPATRPAARKPRAARAKATPAKTDAKAAD